MTKEEMIEDFKHMSDANKLVAFIQLLDIKEQYKSIDELHKDTIKQYEKMIDIYKEFIERNHPEIDLSNV